MTASKYGRPGGNPHYPHSYDSGSGYSNGGGLFGACLPKVIAWSVAGLVGLVIAVQAGIATVGDAAPKDPTHCCYEVAP